MLITKADGSQEEFKPEKLKRSLKRAGARDTEIDAIVSQIEHTLKPGDKTQEIYREAFKILREATSSSDPTAARYSLRRALFELGPTGFPFEDFLARLFESEGYTTKTGITIQGKCVSHEIDLAAYRAEDSLVAEAKFHARPGIKSDLQVAMYSYARFTDLQMRPVCAEDHCGITTLYVITNTKFTHTAAQYANCVGLKLLSWNYPKERTLESRIQEAGIYPVTALTQLSGKHKATLMQSNIVLCRDILHNPSVLDMLALSDTKREAVLTEANGLCGNR